LIGIPRTLAPKPHSGADKRAVGAFEFKAKFTSTLRPEQEPFVAGVFSALENELGCIGEAPTGFGKTTTGCALIADIGRPTCVVIPKGDLDWADEVLRHTDIPKEKIDYWQGGRLPNPDAWVVIAMLQSVYRLNHYPAEVYNRFACLIVDECHRIASEEFSALMRQFPAMFRLGLSATPDRRDGKMPLIHSHMGWRHVVGHSDADQPDYYVINSTWSEPPDPNGGAKAYDPSRTDQTKRSMMKDPIRNAAIAGAAYRAHKAGRRTIVFIEQIKHGELLKAAIRSMGVPKDKIIEYNGGTNAADRTAAKACEAGVILIATYKYAAEGTNIPRLDCAIIAHPLYDIRQSVGRILRKLPGKPKPIVLAVWDVNSPTLRRIAQAGRDYLMKQGAAWKGEFK
jgi:superfamily II DNA or RNA helicase